MFKFREKAEGRREKEGGRRRTGLAALRTKAAFGDFFGDAWRAEFPSKKRLAVQGFRLAQRGFRLARSGRVVLAASSKRLPAQWEGRTREEGGAVPLVRVEKTIPLVEQVN